MAGAFGCLLIGLYLGSVLWPKGTATQAPVATPTPLATTGPTFAPLPGPVVAVHAILGAAAKLSDPLEAVELASGTIVVADTGNSRVVLLDASGRQVRVIAAGSAAFKRPYAVIADGSGFDVLDAERGTIERFDGSGRFTATIAQDPALRVGRDLARAPDGRIYVPNPMSNSVVVVSPAGKVERQLTSPLGAGPGQFNQPSAMAVGADGTLYILDNINTRIEALTSSGSFVEQWPAPGSDTLHSVHVLALPGGSVLATDPAGALLLYHRGAQQPTREPLHVSGPAGAQMQLVGLSRTPRGEALMTDIRGNRLLVAPLP